LIATLLLIASTPQGTSAQFCELTSNRPFYTYDWPRPGYGAVSVPLKTSYYVVFKGPSDTDTIDPDTIRVQVRQGASLVKETLSINQTFAPGCSGWIRPDSAATGAYITTDLTLNPSTVYTTRVWASSLAGHTLPDGYAEWTWTTEDAPTTHTATYNMNWALYPPPRADWVGEHFVGMNLPTFCGTEIYRKATKDFLYSYRRNGYPNQWTLASKDGSVSSFAYRPDGLIPWYKANAVRELETRRIYDMQTSGTTRILYVEDFYGHEQYHGPRDTVATPDNRPISAEYQPGDVVSIADGVNFVTATVVSILDTTGSQQSLEVTGFADPDGGWLIPYAGILPTVEDPRAPGLFPPGGCYLRTFSRMGTPRYYWGRIDKEFDTTVNDYDERLVVTFWQAPGDLSYSGREQDKAKDNAELWQAVYDIVYHIIDRYGPVSQTYYWHFFGEPDWGGWKGNWTELQEFYDYGADAVSRAFEDKGWDSSLARVGINLAGVNYFAGVKDDAILAHCSPGDDGVNEELVPNACYADSRLNGRRSQRVETLCSANGGTGSPLDFLAIEMYNPARPSADRLIDSMQTALDMDPDHFANLAMCSFAAAPAWSVQRDYAAKDSFLGNGFYASWCADIMRRRLWQAQEDPRFNRGDTILQGWPWPVGNFDGYAEVARNILVDSNGDGTQDYSVVVNNQICHFVNFISTMRNLTKVHPDRQFDGYVTGAFYAAGDGTGDYRGVFYAHSQADFQSRSDRNFVFNISFTVSPWETVRVTSYQLDKNHNTYYDLAQVYRERPSNIFQPALYTPEEVAEVRERARLRVTKQEIIPRDENGAVTTSVDVQANGVNLVILSDGALPPPPTPTPLPSGVGGWLSY